MGTNFISFEGIRCYLYYSKLWFLNKGWLETKKGSTLEQLNSRNIYYAILYIYFNPYLLLLCKKFLVVQDEY